MAYLLEGLTIKSPTTMRVARIAQYVQHKSLDGTVSRDYMGDDKLIFELNYDYISVTDYSLLVAIYDDYISVGARYFDTTGEAVLYGTLVHVELGEREFSTKGDSYISNFTLRLTEA